MSPRPTITTLSPRRRRIYFRLLLLVFVVVVSFLFLYATGYRFESVTGLTKTGGIYVGAEESGTEIYLDGELVHEIGTFRRAFFIQDLKPRMYTVTVSKAGYHPWGKTLPVYEHIVTEAQAFTMPQEPTLELIPATFTNQTTNVTSTVPSLNPVYRELLAHFVTATTTATSTSAKKPERTGRLVTNNGASAVSPIAVATTTKEFRGMRLYEDGGRIVARWMRTAENIPFYFCIREGECAENIMLNTKGEKPSYFDFFPGTSDLVIVTLKDGVYVTELDNRSGQNIQPLYLADGADFRIIDGGIYVKTSDDTIYRVEI